MCVRVVTISGRLRGAESWQLSTIAQLLSPSASRGLLLEDGFKYNPRCNALLRADLSLKTAELIPAWTALAIHFRTERKSFEGTTIQV